MPGQFEKMGLEVPKAHVEETYSNEKKAKHIFVINFVSSMKIFQ